MPRNTQIAKNWCFTLNNYTADDIRRIRALVSTEGIQDKVSYLIAGREVASTGTPHLQGFVQFKRRLRISQVKALIGQRGHFEPTRSVSASVEYCKKEDTDPIEIGSLGARPGERSDLDEFKAAVKADPLMTLADVRELHSDVYSRYSRFCIEYLRDHAPAIEVTLHPLRPWQTELMELLSGDPDDRKINFVVDYEGNNGKTWFGRYMMHLRTDVQVLIPGKKADMAYALNSRMKVFIMDAPRSKQAEFIQYDFLEEVKNGYIFSSKYESAMIRLPKCHVVVMMNEDPDMTKLSADRYNIIQI